MKKIAAILLVGILMTTCVACSRGNTPNNDPNSQQNGTQNTNTSQADTNRIDTNQTDTNQIENGTDNDNGTEAIGNKLTIENAEELLSKVWERYEDTDTDNNYYNDKFSVLGGHHESYVEGKPGQYDLTKPEDLESMYCFPAAQINLIDDAATMVHLMEAGDFTVGAYHVRDRAKLNEVVKGIENCVRNKAWNQYAPDELLIMTVGEEYVVAAMGEDELLSYFKAGMQTVYKDYAQIVLHKELD